MALFTRGVLTKKGQALIAKSEATAAGITLTKAMTGAGVYTDTSVSALETTTDLLDPKQTFAISGMQTIDGNSGVLLVTILIHNRGLEELYILNELGIYAEDPDEGEILYCLLVSTDNQIYLPADNGTGGISAIREQVYLEVTNAESTVIDTTGAVIGRDEYAILYELVQTIAAGLQSGGSGQTLVKIGSDDYDYGWRDALTFTGSYADFPTVGQNGGIYVDTDTSEIYVWKLLDTEEYGYFKLPLGSEASETLQRQITANRNAIIELQQTTTALVHAFDEVVITVPTAGWEASEEDDIAVYSQEIEVTGMTDEKEFDVLAFPQTTGAVNLEAEQKAIGIFFAHGNVEGDDGKIVLSCRKKKPAADFGIVIRGDLT